MNYDTQIYIKTFSNLVSQWKKKKKGNNCKIIIIIIAK